MSIRQKIVSLAQKISGTETAFTENDPEYYALECLVTDEMADVAMHMDLRVPISAKKLSAEERQTSRGNERGCSERWPKGVSWRPRWQMVNWSLSCPSMCRAYWNTW